MWYTVQHGAISLGTVELPVGVLAAARLEPARGYATVEPTVRRATSAFLHVGVFGAAAPLLPSMSASERDLRQAMARAARLDFTLVGADGARAHTSFVNLLESPLDGGVVVLASFVSAFAPIGSPSGPSRRPGTDAYSP